MCQTAQHRAAENPSPSWRFSLLPASATPSALLRRDMEQKTLPLCLSLLVLILSEEALAGASTDTDGYGGHGARLDNGLGKTPPMGWNSWGHYRCSVTETAVRRTADAIVSSGLARLGYRYINIDDCWAQWDRSRYGYLVSNATSFPSGIRALAKYVHARGLLLGIYSDAGTRSCQGQPGSLGYEKRDAATFAAWGVDYLKYANCHNHTFSSWPRYRRMSNALLEVGHPIFFSICEWGTQDVATWAPAIGNSWRTTKDITDKWESIHNIADKNNMWATYGQPGAWNDPDMLMVGNGGMTKDEYVAHFSLWALMKAPLLIGCDVTKMDSDMLEILSNKEVIDINQDELGVQGKKVSQSGPRKQLEVWAGLLSGHRMVVLLWNRRSKVSWIKVTWADLGFDDTMKVHIRDLWKHFDLPSSYTGSFGAIVRPHAVKMYTFTQESY